MSGTYSLSEADRERVVQLLGRPLRGRCRVAVRGPGGDPAVIENEPFLEDGTPMPTRFWLIEPELCRAVGQLESAGGVDQAEAELGEELLAEAHAAHERARSARIPEALEGPRPTGGVGGTRRGVKCLHAHLAAELAEGDPVGVWVRGHLAQEPHLAKLLEAMEVDRG